MNKGGRGVQTGGDITYRQQKHTSPLIKKKERHHNWWVVRRIL